MILPEQIVFVSTFHVPLVLHTKLVDVLGREPPVQEKEQESLILLLQFVDNTAAPDATGQRIAEGLIYISRKLKKLIKIFSISNCSKIKINACFIFNIINKWLMGHLAHLNISVFCKLQTINLYHPYFTTFVSLNIIQTF